MPWIRQLATQQLHTQQSWDGASTPLLVNSYSSCRKHTGLEGHLWWGASLWLLGCLRLCLAFFLPFPLCLPSPPLSASPFPHRKRACWASMESLGWEEDLLFVVRLLTSSLLMLSDWFLDAFSLLDCWNSAAEAGVRRLNVCMVPHPKES